MARHIVVKRPIGPPSAPQLGSPTGITSTTLTIPLALPAFGAIPIASYTLQRSSSPLFTSPVTLATGLAIFGASGYPDTQLSASTTYYYRAFATDTTGRVSTNSAIVSQTTAATATDISAPTIPRALAAVSTSTQVTFRVWQACDKHDGTQAGSGVAAYRRYRNGSRVLPDLAAPSANVIGQPTLDSIGTAGATFTRQGVDWDMTAAGVSGLDTTSDSIGFERVAWARGDVISATIAAFTSPDSATFPGQYGGAGVTVRESNAAGAKFIAVYYTFIGRIYVKWRGTTNGSISEAFVTGDGAFRSLHIDSLSDGTFVCYYENSSQQLVVLKTTTTAEVNLAATGLHGTFICSLTANSASAQFRQIAMRPRATVDYTITTSTSETVEFEAVDVAGNVSAKSAAVTAAPVSGLTKKWNPGHYLRPGSFQQGWSIHDSLRDRVYAILVEEPRFKGGFMGCPWGMLETSQGVYDFSQIHRDIAVVRGMGKKLIIELTCEWFHIVENGLQYLPQYLADGGGIADSAEGSGGGDHFYRIDFNQAWVMDRFLALHAALAADLDNNPDVELITFGETAGVGSSQWTRAVAAMGLLWPHTNVVLTMNYVNVTPGPLLAAAAAAGVGVGGPDTRIPAMEEDMGSRALRGVGIDYLYPFNPSGGTTDFGTVDYRESLDGSVPGKIPVCYQYERLDAVPASAIEDYSYSTLRCTHVPWATDKNAWDPDYCDTRLGCCYENGIYPTLNAVNFRIHTRYPYT